MIVWPLSKIRDVDSSPPPGTWVWFDDRQGMRYVFVDLASGRRKG